LIPKESSSRPVFRFQVGQKKYAVRDPIAAEIAAVEVAVARRHSGEDRQELSADAAVDSQFVYLLASIVEPQLDVDQMRSMSRRHYTALRSAVFQVLQMDQMDDILFFPDADKPGHPGTDKDIPVADFRQGQGFDTTGPSVLVKRLATTVGSDTVSRKD